MANEVNIKIKADDMASSKIKGVSDKAKSLRGTFVGLAAAGGVATGVFAAFTKSSLDQQIGINQLDNALKNVNTSYAEQKTAIEEAIAATQNKTNFGDEEQRQSLARIISLTGDSTNALEALSVSTDLAAAMGMDLSNASLLVSKALSGQASSLTRYGIQIEEGATNTEILATLQEKFAGSAEAAADPTKQLGNRMGDLAQSIGDVLLPVMETLIPAIDNAVQKVIGFTEANPELTKVLVIAAGALGAIALALGTFGIAIPPIITALAGLKTAFVLLKATMLTNPFGLIAIAIGTLAAVGIPLLIKNFDKIRDVVVDVVNAVVTHFENMANNVIGIINVMIEAFNFINVFGDDIDTISTVTFPKLEKSIERTTDVIKDNTDALKNNAEEAMQMATAKIDSSEEVKQALLDDMEEIAKFEDEDRKRRGAEIRAAQREKEAVQKGDFGKDFDDFLAIELNKLKGLHEVIDVGGRNMSNDLANAFRNFKAGSQISEHGERGAAAQAGLHRLMDNAGFFDGGMPMLPGMAGSIGTAEGAAEFFNFGSTRSRGSGGGAFTKVGDLQVFVEGDMYGMDDFDTKVNQAVQTGIQSGIIEPTSDIT
tara:strand:- start:59 stop:1852 length:1794 start_codon:yes stop_codon:yes gene_type:complete